jgi:hypothetical protein
VGRYSKNKEITTALWDVVAVVCLFQSLTIFGVSNRFDYRPSPDGKLYAWDLIPR